MRACPVIIRDRRSLRLKARKCFQRGIEAHPVAVSPFASKGVTFLLTGHLVYWVTYPRSHSPVQMHLLHCDRCDMPMS